MGVLRLVPFLLNFANKRCRVRYSGNALMRAIAWSLSISPRPTPGYRISSRVMLDARNPVAHEGLPICFAPSPNFLRSDRGRLGHRGGWRPNGFSMSVAVSLSFGMDQR